MPECKTCRGPCSHNYCDACREAYRAGKAQQPRTQRAQPKNPVGWTTCANCGIKSTRNFCDDCFQNLRCNKPKCMTCEAVIPFGKQYCSDCTADYISRKRQETEVKIQEALRKEADASSGKKCTQCNQNAIPDRFLFCARCKHEYKKSEHPCKQCGTMCYGNSVCSRCTQELESQRETCRDCNKSAALPGGIYCGPCVRAFKAKQQQAKAPTVNTSQLVQEVLSEIDERKSS